MSEFVTKFATHRGLTLDGDDSEEETTSPSDKVYEYATSVVGLGWMGRNFSDATREGDGERLVRSWKFLMLHFKADGRTKYAVEAFNLLAQVNATLPPQMAYRLMWNRTCNPKGSDGKNISMDLRNEHLNRVFKDDLNTFRANISEKSVARSSQALGQLSDMLEAVNHLLHVKTPSGRHIGPNVQKDFETALKVLQGEKVFEFKEGRKHKTFLKASSDPFIALRNNPAAFQTWLKRRRKAAAIEAQLLARVF